MKIAVLHGEVPADAPEDQQDDLIVAGEVYDALKNLGHQPRMIPFGNDLGESIRRISSAGPDFVFNLVESFRGDGKLAFLGARILEYMNLPCTGNGSASLYYAADKVLTKTILKNAGISTPLWLKPDSDLRLDIPHGVRGPFIIKHRTEHASVGIDETSVVEDPHLLCHEMERRSAGGASLFAEQFIRGREFNVSMMEQNGEVKVFTPQEVCFNGSSRVGMSIVTYEAKWRTDSVQYRKIRRHSDYPRRERPRIEAMMGQARRCWDVLQMGGYARVDFRMDERGNTHVIDVNANPCLTHDSNFIISLSSAGLSYEEIINKIIGRFTAIA